jgi:predicted RNA binding protein YcfA (HicA-like mRNA interferase family)
MGREEKLLDKLRNNPKNVRFEELDNLLQSYGFECRKPKRGTHYVYKHKRGASITVPYAKPMKSTYVKKVIALIEEYCQEAD